MEAIDEISVDLSWRETELGLLKILLQKSDVTEKQREVLSRAAWSLLYAHFEGFAKFCLTVYFDRAALLATSCRALPPRTREHALGIELKRLRNLPSGEFLAEIENFHTGSVAQKPTFPEVDTKSNLWPNVLEDLLEVADLKCVSVDRNRVLLKALVGKRNKIAHGKRLTTHYDDYVNAENAVYEVMYELAYEIDERLKAEPFVIENGPEPVTPACG